MKDVLDSLRKAIVDGQAKDAAKMILAGAGCVQVVSTLFRNKIPHLAVMVKDLAAWMDRKGHRTLADFRGTLSAKNAKE